MISEFAKTVNSKQMHTQLMQVKKKNDESYQAYVYRVLEIASNIEIETNVKIQNAIDGIIDDGTNKSILYGARSTKELRERLTLYEAQKNTVRNRKQCKGDETRQNEKNATRTEQ